MMSSEVGLSGSLELHVVAAEDFHLRKGTIFLLSV